MQHNVPILFENIPEKQLVGKNYFAVENIEVIAEGNLLTVVQLEN
jgi:hypothetical protein